MRRRRPRINLPDWSMLTALHIDAVPHTSSLVSATGQYNVFSCCHRHRLRSACSCEHTNAHLPRLSVSSARTHRKPVALWAAKHIATHLRVRAGVAAPYLALLVLNEPVLFRYHADERLVHVGKLSELFVTAATRISTHTPYGTAQRSQLHRHVLNLRCMHDSVSLTMREAWLRWLEPAKHTSIMCTRAAVLIALRRLLFSFCTA